MTRKCLVQSFLQLLINLGMVGQTYFLLYYLEHNLDRGMEHSNLK